jgi:acyl-CoA synthetase (AMP-forming)/AMP-acid ligase II
MPAVDRTHLVETDRSRWCLPLLLRDRARSCGERRFLSFARDEVELTYREVDERTDALATGFAELGLAPGDRVLLMLPNRVENVLSWFALNKLGVTQVPVNNDYKGVFLEHVVNWSGTSTMVVDADLLRRSTATAMSRCSSSAGANGTSPHPRTSARSSLPQARPVPRRGRC